MSVERDTRVEVWIATGLRRRYRVCSMEETFGEWDSLPQAQAFMGLLLEGNPNMVRLA